MSSEAWLDTGNCGECRRKKFCNVKCKKARERENEYALRLQLTLMLARKFRANITTDEASMKKALRETEKSVMGRDALPEEIDSIYRTCYDLAIHSVYSVYAVVSVLCASCHTEKISLSDGLNILGGRLRELAANTK